MDYHHHARLTWRGRELLAKDVLEGRLGLCAAAAEHRVSRQTALKWVKRYREFPPLIRIKLAITSGASTSLGRVTPTSTILDSAVR